MRRKNGIGLVANEVKVLEALVEFGDPVHGYKVVKKLESSDDKLAMSTVYRCLSRLEERGFIKGKWVHQAGKTDRPVRFFSVTITGKRRLEEELAAA